MGEAPNDGDLTGIPKEGEIIAGKFTVEKVLGVGGMGVVVAARHVQLGQRVAVKFLRPEATKHKEAVGRFLREARSTVGLHSAHVVRIIDVGTLDTGLPYMVMEHLAGEDLSDVIKSRKMLGVEEAVDYVLQSCEAIAEAHGVGIVHRDLKPSNLFLLRKPDGSPLVKVLDFGISKAVEVEGEQNLTATSSVMGSPLYMSPEQLRSSKRVDARTDIWALGVILFELTSGTTPFDDETMTGLCAKIVADPPASLRSRRADLPLAFEGAVMRCLEKDVTRRYQTVGDLAIALRDFASAEGRMSADRVARIASPMRAPLPSGNFPPSAQPQPSPSTPRMAAGPVSGHTGFADTIDSWSGGQGKKRRRTTVLVVALVAAMASIACAAIFVATRTPPQALPAAQTPAATVPTATTTTAALAPLPPLDPFQPDAGAPAASSTAAASAKRPVGQPFRSATGQAPGVKPTPPTPPQGGGDLLLDRK